MKRLNHILIALLFGGYCGQAGAQTFNVRSDPFGQGQQEGAWAVEVNGDGNYVVILSSPFQDSLFYSSVVTSLLIGQEGNIMGVDKVVDPWHATYPGWSNSTHQRADGGFVVGGGNFRTDSLDNWIQRPVLFFFDGNGAYEQQIPLGPDNQEWIGRQAKQTSDGGYVICGETTVGGTQSDAFVIKTDPQGNEEWMRTYGGPWNDFTVTIDNATNGGYFLGGEKRVSSNNSQLWVQALNDTGGVVWEKTWGSAYHEPNAHITTAADGNILVASCWAYGQNFLIRRYLAKLDASDGSIIWQKQYANTALNYPVLHVVHEIEPDGDLISVSGEYQGGQYSGVLLRTNSTGDSLWMRHYQYHDSIVSNGGGLFRDVIPTPDSGFIAVGIAMPIAGVYTQDAWVVKVDQQGCIEPGCHIISGMETQITSMRDVLRVWPNPSQGGSVQLAWALPEHFKPQGQLKITITSSDGRLVHEEQVVNSSTASTPQLPQLIRLPHLPAGLYHLHLTDASRWISGAKLVVE